MASKLNRFSSWILVIGFLSNVAIACKEDAKPKPVTPEVSKPVKKEIKLLETPSFDATKAYNYVQKQVDFGPRVPNSKAHKECASWLEKELKEAGLSVNVQEARVKAFNGVELEIFNIMGQLNPAAEKRILLCAHWDSRPFADRDIKDQNKAIDGANDGGSGVAVLLEIADILSKDSTLKNIGIDIVFFDAEDYGKPEVAMIGQSADSWCLGSQYWATNLPIEDYTADFGILLDMVGAKNAVFPKESFSMQYALDQTNMIWNIARSMGHNYFLTSSETQLLMITYI
jgi:glutaminyl-peptide cyclotransferase